MNCKACRGENSIAIRLQTQRDGRQVQVRQCLICGQHCGAVKQAEWVANPLPFDEALRSDYDGTRWKVEREAREESKRLDREQWFREHDAYLRTPEWQALRRKVIERENGLCQGCRSARGVEVHHLTYERHKRELLIDLVLLCLNCHERAHEKGDAA